MVSLLRQFTGFSRNARLLLVTVVCAGMSMALNTLFLNFYLQRLGLSQQLIGVVNALPAVVLVVVGFPVGRLVDRYGARRGLLLGAGIAVAGSAGIAASGTASAILVFSALLGVGSAFGFISVAPFQMASSTGRDRVALFSAQAALMTGTSFVGNLMGGRLPGLLGAWLGAAPDALAPLRATMLVCAGLWGMSAIPMLMARTGSPAVAHASDGATPIPSPVAAEGRIVSPTTHASAYGTPVAPRLAPAVEPASPCARRRVVSRPDVVVRLLLPAFLISLGAGQTIPFLNLFISNKFGVDFASVGAFFAFGALGTMLATLAQPLLAAKYGKIQSVLLVQIGSIPFLLILGFAPFFWLVAVSFVVRNALMNMGNPVYQAFAQEQIPSGEQATYSSLASIAWSLGWASGSTFSGWWRGRVGFQAGFDNAFALMTVLYVLAIGLMYVFFVRGPAPDRAGKVKEAGT